MRQDFDDKLIAIMQQLLRLLGKSNAGRCTRNNHGACLECRTLGEKADNLRDGKDEITNITLSDPKPSRVSKEGKDSRQRAVLQDLAVLQAAELELSNIGNEVLGHKDRTDGAGTVKAFGVAPLRLGKLRGTARNIITGGVSEHVVESVGLRHVLRLLSYNNGELGLVIGAVAGNCMFGDDGWCWPRVRETGIGLTVI